MNTKNSECEKSLYIYSRIFFAYTKMDLADVVSDSLILALYASRYEKLFEVEN